MALSMNGMDGWMFEFFLDAQPQKGIQRLDDSIINTILHYELVWKKTQNVQD